MPQSRARGTAHRALGLGPDIWLEQMSAGFGAALKEMLLTGSLELAGNEVESAWVFVARRADTGHQVLNE